MSNGTAKQTVHENTISIALSALPSAESAEARMALGTPDMYPAKNVARHLGVTAPAVHAWRRQRGIKKARA